jgi:hypothetical protein
MILISRDWTADGSLIRYGAVAGLDSAALTVPHTCRPRRRAFYRIRKHHHACWVVSYLEGTRLTSKKVLSVRRPSWTVPKPAPHDDGG